ncbi:TraR/DksA C4-type zinc finger protein [Gilliamella sp. B14384H2]|uniref:TraR/DksA C4-type zinc finger protein n=1 Tax=unclassified Gilliamella TaxID=2685620 RepID=UPI0018DB9B82|nr:TraR/DksA C4-type zinc finger protein [Gilliamella sp. B14384G10]MBI0040670.1 TraR/DksA C4-type zinc finger protein [Gilliamella sp. B14384G7]MBI0050713.1 TraR/DksA C4-type zinc finger protein [Gilliamella sp. B14384G13]MBI0053005.1 TraR/DksA C4-type zinc finger protein [Gilliamella sp. B14384H2]
MDNADLATTAEMEALDRALAKHQTKTGVSSLYCRICEEPIAEERRKVLVTDLCIECASIEEKRNKR